MQALLSAVQHLPNASYVAQQIMGKNTMSMCQKIIAAIFSLTDKEKYGFLVTEEPQLIERIIEAAELPMTGESYAEVKSRLSSLQIPLQGIGVEVIRNGNYMTLWGPGGRRG
ncbi:hypothetical protein [Pseudomonas sp. Irchel s3b6]|uniref:hypothetical protein n=1 Tax=Pseudomonas sp. Irchel s3b6 TaxID=2009078 RepID=UPI00114071ED|nr:hypothetical protein [Pseudomonas sp. Irchel s3b6]